MPVQLVVEDGTSKIDANSYVAVADVRQYATNRGIDLSALTDDQVSSLAISAADYLETFYNRYVGQPTTVTQALSWPRMNVEQSDGSLLPDSGAGSIPQTLKNAQCQLCIEQNNGVVLLPTTDYNTTGGFVVRQKIDVLETQFSEKIGTSKEPVIPAVDRWLQTLLSPRPGGLIAVRV